MASRRRLSNNSGGLLMNADDKDYDELFDDEDAVFQQANNKRKSMNGRRRSLIAANSSKEQLRIAEMYKTVIQMSSENKLNEKNSWSYDLIDHMGNLIRDETQQGVNFQKASCTLDASVKIYSNRVDDTYSSSHRILESLSRNGNTKDTDGGDEEPSLGKAKVGSKASSNRLNIAETIERNVDNLNAVKLENDYTVDPLFHKLSKAFDDGGAKGMLMNNMRVDDHSSSLTFQFEELIPSDCVSFEANVDEADDFSKLFTIDISEIMVSTSALLADLPKLNICDTLDTYREKLGISPCLDGAVEYYDNVTLQTYSNSNWLDANSTEPQNEDIPVVNDDIDDYVDDFDAGEDIGDYFVDNNDALDDEATDDLPLTKPIEYEEPKNMKIKWSDTTGERSDGSSIDLDVIQQGLNNLNATDAQDYSYFQINALAKSNNAWAGARHWNYATRLRSQANKSPEGVDEVEATEANKKEKKSSKKNIPKIEFTGEFVDESLLACAKKGKSNPTKLTSTALEKAAKEASSLMLPEDKKVHIKDLCRLFLAPQVIVPPPHALSVVLSTVLNSDSSKDKKVNSSKFPLMYANSYNGINDTVWGGAMGIKNAAMKAGIRPQMVSQTNFNRSEFGDQPEARNSDYDDVNDYYDDAGEAGDITMNNYDSQQYSENTEFAVDHTQLLQATRKVEKIEIGYAKVSKKVNIQQLKSDIWSNISTNLDPENSENYDCNEISPSTGKRIRNSGSVPSNLSFQDMVSTLAENPNQKDVTLPFYFICLLHLANENNLCIEDTPQMDELIISMDK